MWHWTESYSVAVGFATWILQRDGLHVPPFDAHAPGDGELRSVGLNGFEWSAWLAEIVGIEDQAGEAASAPDLRAARAEELDEIKRLDDRRNPVECWPGAEEIHGRLEKLWTIYQPFGEGWVRTMTSAKRHSRISAGQERRLWRQLGPFRGGLPTLHVYVVDYPRVVAMPILPVSCVVGLGASDPDGRGYVDLVTAAARELASPASRGHAD
jgi:hypothetical protein